MHACGTHSVHVFTHQVHCSLSLTCECWEYELLVSSLCPCTFYMRFFKHTHTSTHPCTHTHAHTPIRKHTCTYIQLYFKQKERDYLGHNEFPVIINYFTVVVSKAQIAGCAMCLSSMEQLGGVIGNPSLAHACMHACGTHSVHVFTHQVHCSLSVSISLTCVCWEFEL